MKLKDYVNLKEFNISKLLKEIIISSSVSGVVDLTINEDVVSIGGDAILNEAALDLVISEHEAVSLEDYKLIKNSEIDSKTRELIFSGFSYNGKLFSLSEPAQINWQGLEHLKLELTYPYNITTLDDQEYSMADSVAVHNFFLKGINTKTFYINSGRSLKVLVKAATTILEVNAIMDNR